VWFRRGRLLMVSPDSQGTACPLSGRNSTYRPVQISGTGSVTVTTRFSGGMCYETPIETIGELAFRQRGIVGGALPTVQR
jgi:hypothetical protein